MTMQAASSTYRLTLSGPGLEIDRKLDPATVAELVSLVIGGHSTTPNSSDPRPGSLEPKPPRTKRSTRSGGRRVPPKVVSGLSLRPRGKVTFVDFAQEKQPKTHAQRQVVCVQWLRHEAEITAITADHINTCYLEIGWPRPSDLANSLQLTAARKGWLDTSDMADVRLTVRGEDEVRHKLPPTTPSNPA